LNNAHHIWSTKYFSDIPAELISQKENNEKIWQAAFGSEEIRIILKGSLGYLSGLQHPL
jgi:hypothetical protein